MYALHAAKQVFIPGIPYRSQEQDQDVAQKVKLGERSNTVSIVLALEEDDLGSIPGTIMVPSLSGVSIVP